MVLPKYATCLCFQIKCKHGRIWEGEMSKSLVTPAQEPQWVVRMEGQGAPVSLPGSSSWEGHSPLRVWLRAWLSCLHLSVFAAWSPSRWGLIPESGWKRHLRRPSPTFGPTKLRAVPSGSADSGHCGITPPHSKLTPGPSTSVPHSLLCPPTGLRCVMVAYSQSCGY